MIECSVFGYLWEIDCLCRYLKPYKKFEKIFEESIYSNGIRTLIIFKENEGLYLLSRTPPDRNKNKTVLCSEVQQFMIRTPDWLQLFLQAFGFELVRCGKVIVIKFEKNNVVIEISKCESEDSNARKPYIVKVYAIVGNTIDGENMVGKVVEELEEQVHLIKPPVEYSKFFSKK